MENPKKSRKERVRTGRERIEKIELQQNRKNTKRGGLTTSPPLH